MPARQKNRKGCSQCGHFCAWRVMARWKEQNDRLAWAIINMGSEDSETNNNMGICPIQPSEHVKHQDPASAYRDLMCGKPSL